jgi:hypothetical protein
MRSFTVLSLQIYYAEHIKMRNLFTVLGGKPEGKKWMAG